MTRAQRAALAESYRRFAEAVVDAIWPAVRPHLARPKSRKPTSRARRPRRAPIAA